MKKKQINGYIYLMKRHILLNHPAVTITSKSIDEWFNYFNVKETLELDPEIALHDDPYGWAEDIWQAICREENLKK